MPSNRSNPPPASVSPSLHLAAFYTDMPELWFQQAEAQFRLKGVVADDAKFDHLVATLPQDVARQVIRVLRAPPHTGKYLALKTELLSVFGASRAARADALLSLSGLGDRKPSQLASEMLALLGDEPHHILVTRLFVRQLPADIRLQLAEDTTGDLRRLAARADQLWQEKQPTVSAVPSVSAVANSRHSSPARRSPSPYRRRPKVRLESTPVGDAAADSLCYYHRRFGAKARYCRPPCQFQGNGVASRHS